MFTSGHPLQHPANIISIQECFFCKTFSHIIQYIQKLTAVIIYRTRECDTLNKSDITTLQPFVNPALTVWKHSGTLDIKAIVNFAEKL